MGCHIAENRPLSLLRDHLGLEEQCHSFRTTCAMARDSDKGHNALGAPGAVIGYCQALFNYQGSARRQTEHVMKMLKDMSAPWWASHEMFWGYRGDESASDYLRDGMEPLRGFGRMPVLITGLDPLNDMPTLENIFSSKAPVVAGETVLVRMSIGSVASAQAAGAWVRRLYGAALESRSMPEWWPLFQSPSGSEVWNVLREESGDAWPYVNVAVNPFASDNAMEAIGEQLTVAQVTIGLSEGIGSNGKIQLAPGMKIMGAPDKAEWDFNEYFAKISTYKDLPTLIVLGPSQPEWTDQMNADRIRAILPLLSEGCEKLWRDISQSRRDMLLSLAA